jgi:hypothetical protein
MALPAAAALAEDRLLAPAARLFPRARGRTVSEVPAGAQRSPDGHYWWDGGTWQAVAGGQADTSSTAASTQSQEPAASGPQNGQLTIEIGAVTEVAHSHDEVVAMLEQAGTPLPEGEAYA